MSVSRHEVHTCILVQVHVTELGSYCVHTRTVCAFVYHQQLPGMGIFKLPRQKFEEMCY